LILKVQICVTKLLKIFPGIGICMNEHKKSNRTAVNDERSESSSQRFEVDQKSFEEEKEDWDIVASGWEKWWKVLEDQGAQQVSERLVSLARIDGGQKVLDLACGYGEPGVTAALKIHPSGSVLGIDISRGLLSIAKKRAGAYGLTNVRFERENIEKIELPKLHFDSVLCRWGLMFSQDVESTMKKIYDCLVSGGRCAVAVWGPPEKVPMLSIPFQATVSVMNSTGASSCAADTQCLLSHCNRTSPFGLSDEHLLKRVFHSAGFREVRIESMLLIVKLDSAKEFAEKTLELSAPLNQILMKMNNDAERVRTMTKMIHSIAEAAARYAGNNSNIVLENEVLLVVGKKE
jgi:ubiquinone/menaquinone biosynthesis C-methylase UbiE